MQVLQWYFVSSLILVVYMFLQVALLRLKSPALLNEQRQLLMLTDVLSKYRGTHESIPLEAGAV